MADPKGERLFVNVGAAEARRRLKQFGHGVRKIHSAGRKRAVIVHTATGRHLEELQAKFADVGYANREDEWNESQDRESEAFRPDLEENPPSAGASSC